MQPSHNIVSTQRQRIQHFAHQASPDSLLKALAATELAEQVETLQPATRQRLFPPLETLSMFMSQVLSSDSSCQAIVDATMVRRTLQGRPGGELNTGGYCKARARLALPMLTAVTRHSAVLATREAAGQWRWRGHPVRLIDGSTLTLADTTDNQREFPQARTQKPGLGFPICRIAALICLGSGVVLDAAMGAYQGKGHGELTMAEQLLDTLNPGDILLGDALYASYKLLSELQRRGVSAVFEQHGTRQRAVDFETGIRLGAGDHLVTLKRPKYQSARWPSREAYEQLPATIQLRECRVKDKVLVTTLTDVKAVSKRALRSLYAERWHIELDLRNIKTTLGMAHLRSRSPQMARKEFWVYWLAYNVIRLMMVRAAVISQKRPRQLSFKHTVQICLACATQGHSVAGQQQEKLLMMISAVEVGNRPGRVEPRALKRRPKTYNLLTRPRHEMQAEIRQFGPQKKQRRVRSKLMNYLQHGA